MLALDGAFDVAAPDAAPQHGRARPAWRGRFRRGGRHGRGAHHRPCRAEVWPSAERRSSTRFDYVLPEGQQLEVTLPQRPVMAISPDGRSFVYQTTEGLYLRSMGNLEAQLIPGTKERLSTPFFSPDGQWVGYFVLAGQTNDRQLKKIAVSGGAAVIPYARRPSHSAQSWTLDNTILFGQRADHARIGEWRTPEIIIRAGESEQMHGPQLSDRASVLFSVRQRDGPGPEPVGLESGAVAVLGKGSVVVQSGSDARYLPTGHVVYALRDGVFGVAFDADRLKVTGARCRLLGEFSVRWGQRGASNYAVSEQGTLVSHSRQLVTLFSSG